MREVKLPSGAVLKVNPAPFAESKDLYQAVLSECKAISFDPTREMASIFKDLVCYGFSSKQVEEKLWTCLGRCQYNELRVEPSIFEPEKAREDYSQVCMEVMKDNISPFLKNLSAVYVTVLGILTKNPA